MRKRYYYKKFTAVQNDYETGKWLFQLSGLEGF